MKITEAEAQEFYQRGKRETLEKMSEIFIKMNSTHPQAEYTAEMMLTFLQSCLDTTSDHAEN